jgi:membrane dipeptidase
VVRLPPFLTPPFSYIRNRNKKGLTSRPLVEMNSFALTPHPRNVLDSTLSLLQSNGGIIMICFVPSLISPPSSPSQRPTLSDVASHIIHAGNLIGYSHVGIGSDFDGMLEGPDGLDDAGCYPSLVVELLRRGVSERDVRSVIGGNVVRVMGEVERCRDRIMREDGGMGGVMCDGIACVWTDEQRGMLVERGDRRMMEAAGRGEIA